MKKSRLSHPSFLEEKLLWENNYPYVIGIDEVGRGAFAGPLVVAAVVFTAHCDTSPTAELKKLLTEVNDSKLLTPSKRKILEKGIKKHCFAFTIQEVSVSVINKYGIGKANFIAMRKAIAVLQKKLKNKKIYVLVDGFPIRYIRNVGIKNQKAIIKGDRKSISIAAASILAKVYRDEEMIKLENKYKNYSFTKHKGYGTKTHQNEIKKYGLSKIHRKSFDLSSFFKV